MATLKPTIAVLHANSKQGTSVVISLLQTDKFAVKALVRTADSDNAKLLALKGADVVAVDQTDAAALQAALDGVYGVFYVTVSLEIAVLQAEYEQGKLVADTAAAAGVKVFVFSTLENVEERTEGKYVVGPFTDKARLADYIKEQHKSMISIFPALGGFYTVFAGMPHLRPRKDDDGVLVFSVPAPGDASQPWVNPFTAIGPVVAAAFLEPETYRNVVIPVYDEVLTYNQMVKTFSDVTGIKARFRQQTQADLEAHLPPPVAAMLCHAMAYTAEYGFYAPERDMELVRTINPHPMSWADFLRKSGYDGTQSEEEIRTKFVQEAVTCEPCSM